MGTKGNADTGRTGVGALMLEALSRDYTLRKNDVGADARLAKKGMVFETESYEVEGVGHLCILRMNAMLGLMKMETAVLAVWEKDLPLLNLDWVKAMGKETQIVELYDVQLAPYPAERLEAFRRFLDRDGDLQDYVSPGQHWYDKILYPCSYHKSGKGIAQRLNAAARDYVSEYLTQLSEAAACDRSAKREKVRGFAETLFAQGGPAVDQVVKLFGRETASRLVLGHMYGVGPDAR